VNEEEQRRLNAAPSETMVCKICHRALEFHRNADGAESWEHFEQDAMAGHKPVPVNSKTGKLLGRCDFCNADLETEIWFLPASDFHMATDPTTGKKHHSFGDWSACPGCASCIERNQWNALVRRQVEVWEQRHGGMTVPAVYVTAWKRMQRLLRANTTGTLYRVE
jgi:NAD-dependent dihydropyrimidine dehydrogenase PreA subunit